MSGQVRSRDRRTTERPTRADRARPVATAVPATAPRRSAPKAGRPERSDRSTDRLLQTRSTYRLLVMRGLAPDEAANLTAYLSGIHRAGRGWKLTEVNQLLFLRELQRSGRFGKTDGTAVAH
ncbi:MAG TPA: hypothetical protein VEG29_02685 [Candidatus Binatia bacterium]|nr:hypothetical protein [Candidatus Binatia bacterium]